MASFVVSRGVLVLLPIVTLLFSGVAQGEKEKCVIPQHYKEIGCTPIPREDGECATSFNCDNWKKSNEEGVCHFRGQNYSDYSGGPSELPPCVPYALCHQGSWMAGHIDCGNAYNYDPLKKCETIRSGCCRQSVCDEELKNLAVCFADNDKHFEGEKWNPTEDKCVECRCDEKWDNSTSIYENPNCKPKDCFNDFWHLNSYKKGCGPMYYGTDRCCPSQTKCPSPEDKIIKGTDSVSTNRPKCKYGDMELDIGDGVSDKNNCMACKCSTPPLITCNWIEGCEQVFA